jgi:hypothetical protein
MKIISRALLCASCVLLCITALYAQNKQFTGYYINKEGDTVTGVFPNYKQSVKSFSSMEFIPDALSNPVKLTPQNCVAFGIQGYDEYVAYSGQRLMNLIDESNVYSNLESLSFDDQYDSVSTFLRLIAKTGDIAIYLLNDNWRQNFFYQRSNEPLQELRFKKYYSEQRLISVSDYQQQLAVLFENVADKKKLYAALKNLPYTEEAMVKLFQQFDSNGKPYKKQKNRNAGLVLGAGVSINSFKVTGDKTVNATQLQYQPSITPIFSVGYLLPSNRNFGKYFNYNSLRVFRYENIGENRDNYYRRKITYSSDLSVAASIGGGINLVNASNIKFFVSGGLGVLFMVNNKEVKEQFALSSGARVAKFEKKLEPLTFNMNTSLGTLLNKRIMITAIYNLPTKIGNFVYYNPVHSSIQLGVGYKLN